MMIANEVVVSELVVEEPPPNDNFLLREKIMEASRPRR